MNQLCVPDGYYQYKQPHALTVFVSLNMKNIG